MSVKILTSLPLGRDVFFVVRCGPDVSMCIFLSVGLMDSVVADLLAGGVYTHATPVAVVARASWPDERILRGTFGDIVEKVLIRN